MGDRYANHRFCNNLDEYSFLCEGKYDIPIIEPTDWAPCKFVPFNTAKNIENRSNRGVHFFIDDYQFERIWLNWKRYGAFLSEFQSVMTPDFSLFTDWPVAVQIWNHYRKHFIGAYLQTLGVNVIPTICWSDEKSYDWCFDGEPTNSCVAVSSVGTQKNIEAQRLFLSGYNAMIERLCPETIIFFGKVPNECKGNIISITPFYDKFEIAKTGNY